MMKTNEFELTVIGLNLLSIKMSWVNKSLSFEKNNLLFIVSAEQIEDLSLYGIDYLSEVVSMALNHFGYKYSDYIYAIEEYIKSKGKFEQFYNKFENE